MIKKIIFFIEFENAALIGLSNVMFEVTFRNAFAYLNNI